MTKQPNQRQRKQPQRSTIIVVAAGVLLLCCLIPAVSWFASRQQAQPLVSDGTPPPANTATLRIAHSPEKAALLKSLADKFNAKGLRAPDRESMRVELISLTPEEMVTQALAGAPFDAMTPDSSLWLDQLNRRWAQNQPTAAAGQITARLAGEPVRYAVTPIVIAAWEDTARSLGWPERRVGWAALQERARSDANFKWSHPSTAYASGLLATLAEFYAGAGVQRGLTAEMARDPKTVAFVSAVEKTVRYYGEAELTVIQNAARQGKSYLDAFVVSEQLLVAYNTGVFGKPPARLVALYPAEGTLWADHPLALLETPALTANQRRTFQALREFLAQPDIQTQILMAGYRPADLEIPLNSPGSPFSEANGVDGSQPQTTLQLPSADVVTVVQNTWALTKRRANVFLVVDTSGSMRGQKMTNMQTALRAFVAQLPSEQERIGLIEFNSGVSNVIELDALSKNRNALTRDIDNMEANGNTALLDGVQAAYTRLQRQADPDRINAIVAMTDGRENASSINVRELTDRIRAGNAKVPVIIFCVAYGSDADLRFLQTIVDSGSGGQVREGTPETIKDLYKILSQYF